MHAPLRAQLYLHFHWVLCCHRLTFFTAALQTDRCMLFTNNLKHKPSQVHYTKPGLTPFSSCRVLERPYAFGQQLALFPAGLLRLEELIRGFLISRETLSIRMLDDNLDPTPLLKEIRDDKIATIIIDANASISYLILKKVSIQPHYLNAVALAHFTLIHSPFLAHFNLSFSRHPVIQLCSIYLHFNV